MIRAVADVAFLFLSPFLLYAVFLALRRRHLLMIENWSGPSVWLAIAGLLLVIASLLYSGLAPRPQSGFEPTRIENGRIVPGHFE
ncbi:MAG: hypothetical protein JO048_12100 [Methylobacteriaceae bacterium]|nr:hypothetical protein [Methylobacteriaceae bacterium]